MTPQILRPLDRTSIVAASLFITTLAGCVVEQPSQPSVYRGRPAVQVQATLSFQDDYDYYPGYETYYSRNRHEFVYRDGNAWVRRSEPRGVSIAVLLAAPTVRLDFHDSPEQHHSAVVQSYPRNWSLPRNDRDSRRDDPRTAERNDVRPAPVAVIVRPTPTVVVVQDDYDYYPGYEVYYSRNRREYVSRVGNTWVRRPEPAGVKLNVLIATPSVRLDFHDSPEQHHSTVVQQYPKNWKRSDKDHDDKDDKKDDRKDDKKDKHDDDKRK